PPPSRLYSYGRAPSSSEEVLNSAGNFNRIPPVLAKPKPPPFNKGGFQQKCADDIRPCIFNFPLSTFNLKRIPGYFLHFINYFLLKKV
ncbi:MAG: hypothetical protein IJA17_09550, partial [Oscillospiraceae bacterium]|nr:hypothetical protein [Oscillospiraceae bacterium]